MQLKRSNKLALAAAGLMAGTQVPVMAADEWSHEAAVLYYGETDDRVQDASLKYQGVRTFDDGEKTLTLNASIDTLTGASPNGVTTSNSVVTVTSASGGGTLTHPAGELPIDNDFKDTRVSLSANWEQPLNKALRGRVGASLSKEYDYLHLGLSAGLSKPLNNKNTTLSAGIAFAADTLEPVGNAPIPLADQNAAKGHSTESKETLDVMMGVTQIVSKNTIAQVNYSFSQADGYLNDPYKWVSLVDNTGSVVDNRHESRPDSRTGHNLYGEIKHHLSRGKGDVVTTSGRLHTDDWGVDSVTLDVKYRIALQNKNSIEPHLRYYHQTAADFYHVQWDSGVALPENASADYRLAEFDAYTLGATYRWQGQGQRKWRVTGEIYRQNPKKVALTAGQAGLDANPGFDAFILSVGVKF